MSNSNRCGRCGYLNCICANVYSGSSSSGGYGVNSGYGSNSGYGGNSGYGRNYPYGNDYSNPTSSASRYSSDGFDRNSTTSSASSYNHCRYCHRPRSSCVCISNQPFVPQRMSTSRPNRNSPAYNTQSNTNSGTCFRCRRSKSNCDCIPGTFYNPGGYSNSRTAYRNSPAFDDPPRYSQPMTRDSRSACGGCGRLTSSYPCQFCGWDWYDRPASRFS
ncbi:uncharacterized protein PAC_11791 [Phialocephala subalpina]|uniref:Uncharacterized protein n=1 Tax=Phialocephala subalpina TaxID=576137 RepID=A0A1L7XA48_9HELO|nr:uncharacterized protein PAC_11791 [Phialocephala subalpina]